jgi:hypothetical protein
MLNASAIYRLLMEDEPLAEPNPPDDPNQLPLDLGPPDDLLDPKREIMRMTAEKPLRIPGSPPQTRYRMQMRLGARNRYKIGNATYLIRHDDGSISCRYHDTDVITAHEDGRVVVDSGGWRPGGANEHGAGSFSLPAGRTTMARINDWLSGSWQIYQLPVTGRRTQNYEGGEWYWYLRGATPVPGHRLMFNDGDTIYPNGSIDLKKPPVLIQPKKTRRQA